MRHLCVMVVWVCFALGGLAQQPATTDSPLAHDPVMTKQGDTYYLFATGQGVSVMSSKDLKTWKF